MGQQQLALPLAGLVQTVDIGIEGDQDSVDFLHWIADLKADIVPAFSQGGGVEAMEQSAQILQPWPVVLHHHHLSKKESATVAPLHSRKAGGLLLPARGLGMEFLLLQTSGKNGGPTRTRTWDKPVMSRRL